MARVHEARGSLGDALALLDEAEAHDRPTPIPRSRPIPAMRARLRIRQGTLAAAEDWVRARRLTSGEAPSYAREFELVTLVRLLVARRDPFSLREALDLLERLREAAERGRRTGSVIETLVLESSGRRELGDVRGALPPLVRALELAEPEGFLRVFLDEGPPARELLRHVVARGLGGDHARRVLSAFDAPAQPLKPSAPTTTPTSNETASSTDALTARELEVLRLIAAGLRNGEIADHLGISAATVKRHIANAYGKLGARHRTEALRLAHERRLL